MTVTTKSRRRLARCLRRFSTGHAGARSNLDLSPQTVQDSSSFDIGYRERIHSLMHSFTVHPCAQSYSHDSSASSAVKSP